ncbi:Copper resistance protein (plasmid) [Rhodovulum sp. P5]|uniref:CopD family protein n=1 Tax=Rhodovulum sp. P5 TaxID=1564506 RepID=UPI0009C36131|nr:CopD family protein [Rhodovulum sp. P5]ARE42405.1 Copper resistance protein [Rhodovulum sp. P5]
MLSALGTIDALTLLSILVKTASYAATLLAAGSVLVAHGLARLSSRGRQALVRTAILAAMAAALFSILRLPLRAGFLMGGTLDGAMDPMVLGMVAESPLGTSIAVRIVGLMLICAIVRPGRIGPRLASVGAVLACVSFALRGHAYGAPGAIAGVLVSVHLLGLAFWIGALGPLLLAARREPSDRAGALAEEFGTKAIWIVGILVAAGTGTLALLGAATPSALATPYGQFFAIKLGLFAGILSLAAVHKFRLTPALSSGSPGSGDRLRRSILVETFLIALILGMTATLTALSSPPGLGAPSAS